MVQVMISFRHFLNGQIKEDTVKKADLGSFDIEQFKADTAPFFKTFKLYLKRGNFLWHGSDREVDENNHIFDFKERTKPRDSRQTGHDTANEFFLKKFGHAFRNWMFVSNDRSTATSYGMTYIVFPIGDVEWFFINGIKDLTNYQDDLRWEVRSDNFDLDQSMTPEDWAKLDKMTTTALTNRLASRTNGITMHYNKELPLFFSHTDEMMIKCGKFYLIHPENMSSIMRQIIKYIDTL